MECEKKIMKDLYIFGSVDWKNDKVIDRNDNKKKLRKVI